MSLATFDKHYNNSCRIDSQIHSQPKVYPDVIDFTDMHSHLNPAWHKRAKVIHSISIGLFACSGAFLVNAVAAYRLATRSVSVATAVLSVLLSSSSMIFGIIFFKEASLNCWEDPHFRIQKSQAIFSEIKQDNLSYKELRKRHQQIIDRYELFTDKQLNKLYQHDIDSLSYTEFEAKHGVGLISKLTSPNKIILQNKFFAHLDSQNSSFESVVNGKVWKLLGSNEWLLQQINHLSYSQFIERSGGAILGLLEEKIIDILALKYLENLRSLPSWSYENKTLSQCHAEENQPTMDGLSCRSELSSIPSQIFVALQNEFFDYVVNHQEEFSQHPLKEEAMEFFQLSLFDSKIRILENFLNTLQEAFLNGQVKDLTPCIWKFILKFSSSDHFEAFHMIQLFAEKSPGLLENSMQKRIEICFKKLELNHLEGEKNARQYEQEFVKTSNFIIENISEEEKIIQNLKYEQRTLEEIINNEDTEIMAEIQLWISNLSELPENLLSLKEQFKEIKEGRQNAREKLYYTNKSLGKVEEKFSDLKVYSEQRCQAQKYAQSLYEARIEENTAIFEKKAYEIADSFFSLIENLIY